MVCMTMAGYRPCFCAGWTCHFSHFNVLISWHFSSIIMGLFRLFVASVHSHPSLKSVCLPLGLVKVRLEVLVCLFHGYDVCTGDYCVLVAYFECTVDHEESLRPESSSFLIAKLSHEGSICPSSALSFVLAACCLSCIPQGDNNDDKVSEFPQHDGRVSFRSDTENPDIRGPELHTVVWKWSAWVLLACAANCMPATRWLDKVKHWASGKDTNHLLLSCMTRWPSSFMQLTFMFWYVSWYFSSVSKEVDAKVSTEVSFSCHNAWSMVLSLNNSPVSPERRAQDLGICSIARSFKQQNTRMSTSSTLWYIKASSWDNMQQVKPMGKIHYRGSQTSYVKRAEKNVCLWSVRFSTEQPKKDKLWSNKGIWNSRYLIIKFCGVLFEMAKNLKAGKWCFSCTEY